jgi:hypothetical protein
LIHCSIYKQQEKVFRQTVYDINSTFSGAGKADDGALGRFGGRVKRIDGGFRTIEALSKRIAFVFGTR